MNDIAILRGRLERAKARRDSGLPFSPDWAAAMSEIDELRVRLATLSILARAARLDLVTASVAET